MQGGLWPGTFETAKGYIEHDFVENVIISTFDDYKQQKLPNGVSITWEDPPDNPGQGNMNMQIITSLKGLKFSKAMIAAKTRTDQCISDESLKKMNDIFNNHDHGSAKKFFKGSVYPLSHIFVLGLQTKFPFQTQDHVFWGFRRDLLNLFACPLNTEPLTGHYSKPEWGGHKQQDVGLNFTRHLRMPIWLSGHYFARFNPVVYHYLENYKEFLCDGKVKQNIAMGTYYEMINDVFKPFPRIKMWWEKMNHEYPHAMYEQQGEINADNWPEKFKV